MSCVRWGTIVQRQKGCVLNRGRGREIDRKEGVKRARKE